MDGADGWMDTPNRQADKTDMDPRAHELGPGIAGGRFPHVLLQHECSSLVVEGVQ